MLNSVVLVGRLVDEPTLKELEKGTTVGIITLAVTRAFKNMEGNYDVDYIRCTLWEGIAESTGAYCHKGDIIGIRGRLVTRNTEVTFYHDDVPLKKKIIILEVVAERVAFIHAARKNRNEEINPYSENLVE